MVSWAQFEAAAPDGAAHGRRLLVGPDGVAIAFLATVSRQGLPRLSPVCPIFCGVHLYVSAGRRTPKVADLRATGAYVLHAFLGPDDAEFQIAGHATEVDDVTERSEVHRAIAFCGLRPGGSDLQPLHRPGALGALGAGGPA